MTIALSALALAAPAALFVLWPLFRRGAAPLPASEDSERAGLLAEKAAALHALRELGFDHEAGHMTDADYAELRARYEGRAGAILRQLDLLGPTPEGRARTLDEPTGGPRTPWTRQSVVLGAAGVAVLGFGVAVGLLVSRFSAPAPADPAMAMPQEMAPLGPGPMASAPGGSGGGAPGTPVSKEVLAGMLAAAHTSLDSGRYQEAISAYKAILARNPDNVEAITHLGVILGLAGHADSAIESFDRALRIDPGYAHALWDKARVLQEAKQDYPAAIAAWESFLRVAPPGQDRDQAQARLKEALAKRAAAPAGSSPDRPAAQAPKP